MRRLAETNRKKVIDLLMERLAFERAAVRLYDVVVERLSRDEPAVRRMLPRMENQRDEEREHVQWLEVQVRELGGDPQATSPRARWSESELHGIERTLLDSQASVMQMCHALLAFELSDEAGWEVLVAVARTADDEPALDAFVCRADEEQLHVVFLRRAVEDLTRNDVLGVPVTLPSAP